MFCEDQYLLFDERPFVTPLPLAEMGSQRWIQVAAEYAPHTLHELLRPTMRLRRGVEIHWRSTRADSGWAEFRDQAALQLLGTHLPYRRLCHFWPPGGPVWDSLGKTTDGQLIFLEAKSHLRELKSPASGACFLSHRMIQSNLAEAREFYAPTADADWSRTYYQYANRLAFHYLFRFVNRLPSHMVFLYFLRDAQMFGPQTPRVWHYGIRRMHRTLGLPEGFHAPGIHEVFLDVSQLRPFVPDVTEK